LSSDGKAITGIGNVVVDTAPNESYLSKITKSHLAQISEIEYSDGKIYAFGWTDDKQPGADFIATGASCTMRAISNSVNGAISFVKSYAFGITIEDKTPFDEFEYTEYINKKDTTVTFADGLLTYNIKTKGNGEADPFTINVTVNSDKKIESFKVTVNGSTYGYEDSMMSVSAFVGLGADELAPKLDDGSLITGATKSNTLCLHAALFATSNYDLALVTGGSN
ncbi:MAG: hypothetical protein OSJ68_08875, partial [Clostridia bacterium]|nr:hypothetical protein [Clostridia bacterium]